MNSRRIVVAAPHFVAESIKRELRASELEAEVDCAASRGELQSALARPAAAVIGAELPDASLVELAGLVPTLQKTTSFVAWSESWRADEFRGVMEAGAADYVTAEQPIRLQPVMARELRLNGERLASAATEERAWLLEKVIDAVPFVLFVKDAEERRIVIANQTYADAFNTTKEWLHGKLDSDYFPPEQAASFVAIDTEVLTSKKMRAFEEVARAGVEGENRIFATRKMPVLDESGEARWLLGVTEDVTERRAAEEQIRAQKAMLEETNAKLEESLREVEKNQSLSARSLANYQQRALQMELIRQQNEDLDKLAGDLAAAKRQAEEKSRELEQAAKLRSEFLANFSHEIRTPLNGIIGYADLLMREEGQRLTLHGRRDLSVVKANAKTLLALINDILDLSKIESGFVDVVVEDVDLVALAEECTATVREYLKGKNVELTTRIDAAAHVIHTDGLKLRQVLLNLLSNAAKFTETGEIVLEIEAKEDGVRIRVEDTGMGIAEDQIPHIFEKFRQVDGTSTRKAGGTGLGLAIVKELSRILGGNVEARSVLGRGSSFEVSLPGVLAEGARKPEATTAPVVEVRPRVLVVDDDPLVHQLIEDDLTDEGFEVLRAMDGVEALQLARRQRPSAVILDLHLPKLDGWSVLSELKADPALKDVPVVLVSVEEQRARGFSLGACEYLVKPVEPERLVSVVNRLVVPSAGEVLVVDDDPQICELVGRSLSHAGFSVADARSGEEALLRMRISPPSLLILDLVMPGQDGFEVLRKVREDGLQIPVVVLTGKTLGAAEEQTLRDGMTSVVQKGGSALESVVAEARRLVIDGHASTSKRKPRILYVEDSPQNRDVVRRYLKDLYEVIEAEDGEHGIERARRDEPELILMDLSLPRVDGWEATRRIKATPEIARLPVVALTAHASREDQQKAREAGCDDYLTKPVDRDLLLETIRRHLNRSEHA